MFHGAGRCRVGRELSPHVGSIGIDQTTKIHAQVSLMRWQDEKDLSLYQGQRYPIFALGSPMRPLKLRVLEVMQASPGPTTPM